MKTLTTRWLAAAAMLAATGTQAATGVLDFEGFTINYDISGFWDQLDSTNTQSTIYRNGTYDYATGTLLGDTSGVKVSSGHASFNKPHTGIDFGSYDGAGTVSLSANLSYSIQVKDGWQLKLVQVWAVASGRYAEQNGGIVSFSTTGGTDTIGGSPSLNAPAAVKTPQLTSPALTTGKWLINDTAHAIGNTFSIYENYVVGNDGTVTGYKSEIVMENRGTPVTAMSGSYSSVLSATTNNPGEIAYISGDGEVFFSVDAMRAVAPVPEPASYGMLAAGFGAIGFLARRQAKKAV